MNLLTSPKSGLLGGLALLLASAASADIRTRIDSGIVAGEPSPYGQIAVFKGIPYAQPPVGALRWRPPQPPDAWQGPRPANEAGLPCWQPQVPETSIYSRGPIESGEDCLYLNVWSDLATDAPKPVLVWFHGGGNTTGHGSSLIFDGTRLAQKGAVVVTTNYRMGPFGFFAHPGLSAESSHGSSGNYGLLDQIATLEWVKRNIAAFGGDPQRVVVFGQSAGSIDACLLMSSPLTAGLISGVIGHSGGCMKTTTPLAEAEANGLAVAALLTEGSPATQTSLAALRAVPPERFVEATGAADVPLAQPIVDGWVVPAAPRQRFLAGRHTRVPLIVGDMADEFRGLGADAPELTEAEYRAQVRERFPAIAGELLAAYADIAAVSPREALWKISTHSFFTWESRTWASAVTAAGERAFVYHFTWPTAVFSLYVPERPEFPDPDGPRGMGAYHSGDLAYHFNNTQLVGLGWTDWDHRLAEIISSYWVNFARNGDPNGPGLPRWRDYDPDQDIVQEFGSAVGGTRHPRHTVLDLFDRRSDLEDPLDVRRQSPGLVQQRDE